MTFTVTSVSKVYGATRALSSVTLELRPGEIVGLIGTNGAGKSTLIKILSGATAPSSGTLSLDGRPLAFGGPLDAQAAGVQTVHQNIDDGVVFGASVADNLTLDTLTGPGWFLTRARVRAAAAAVAPGLGLPLDAPVESLPASARQQIVIARALARRARLLILDEPTSTLSEVEAGVLAARVRKAAAAGVSVLYVSHRLSEIEALCDRVLVLRDGELVATFVAPLERSAIVTAMLGPASGTSTGGPASGTSTGGPASGTSTGGEADAPARREDPAREGRDVLVADGVRAVPGGHAFGFRVRAGEVLGVTGLVGAGKTELLEQLGGARRPVSGRLSLDGVPYRPKDPKDAIAAGVALAPEERAAQAIVPGWSVRAHVTLPWLRRHGRSGLLARRSEAAAARRVIELFGVRGPGHEAPIEALSGGNQQKVVVGRWLVGDLRLLVLDEPFRGVDVAARADIGRVIRDHARRTAVVVASSDPQELRGLADRVLVLHEGDLAGELPIADATPERLAALMSGTSSRPPAGRGGAE
ncbi:sugar ABC transporter ATP-binding protein [Nonomuraea jiangxiensis]|uniref:Simple sugar transport system ATP-binding protein n=1 Tax=Nonomuraea jiangxiensis TaxID=633440 RepID=A0A1G8YPU6_9ACTN|nr:sugar ABC transporter ATP-binding protein [Nonomuraea jiangxiensis]SDK04793.1 simple sugar transport system ATP-binding protein [Nonomuraea jiangxiensis]